MSEPIVVAVGVHRRVENSPRTTEILRGVDLTVAQGEWLAIMGASGSGKSTLLHILGGLDLPSAGSVEVNGWRVDQASESARAAWRKTQVGYVFQSYNLLPELSALGNVALPLRLNGHKRGRARKQARALLDELGVGAQGDESIGELSGGEQQRVALARAVALDPVLLLADEPTGALDTAAGDMVMKMLAGRNASGQAIIMVTHDHRVAAMADRMLLLSDGRIVEEHRLTESEPDAYDNLISLDPR